MACCSTIWCVDCFNTELVILFVCLRLKAEVQKGKKNELSCCFYICNGIRVQDFKYFISAYFFAVKHHKVATQGNVRCWG